MPDDLRELRWRIRPLLDLTSPRDGLTAYYALYHDPQRTELFVGEGKADQPEGFLALCQTGWDLFRRLVVLRARRVRTAISLLQEALTPHRPYYLITTPDLRPAVNEVLEVEKIEVNRIYRLGLHHYKPQVNVLVVPVPGPGDSKRFVIHSGEEVTAEAGINWRSPHFAGIYVRTEPKAQGRGWGKGVLEACIAWLIRSGVQPLYIVSEKNWSSVLLAESVGFVDTGARELAVEGVAAPK